MRRPSQTVGEMTCRVASTPVMDARVARTHAAVMQAATDEIAAQEGRLWITVDPDKVHVFDPKTGARLGKG